MSCTVNPPYVSRDAWRMPGPLGARLPRAVGSIRLHHSVSAVTGDPCADARAVARIGIKRFGRCSYSYMIHPSGVVLEAQGNHKGAHTEGHNGSSVGVVLLGNYETATPSDDMVQSAAWLVWLLRGFDIVNDKPLVIPHDDTSATACPGRHSDGVLWVMRVVASDPNWKPGCR